MQLSGINKFCIQSHSRRFWIFFILYNVQRRDILERLQIIESLHMYWIS